MLRLTWRVGIMMPIFSQALANSSGSTVPLLFRSKYLNALSRTVSSFEAPEAFCDSFCFSVFSKLDQQKKCNGSKIHSNAFQILAQRPETVWRVAHDSLYLPLLESLHLLFLCSVFKILFVIIKLLSEEIKPWLGC